MTRKRLWRRSARGFIVAATKNGRLHRVDGAYVVTSSKGRMNVSARTIVRSVNSSDATVKSQEVVTKKEESSSDSVAESFRRSWHEAMTGQLLPVSQLWDDMDDD